MVYSQNDTEGDTIIIPFHSFPSTGATLGGGYLGRWRGQYGKKQGKGRKRKTGRKKKDNTKNK